MLNFETDTDRARQHGDVRITTSAPRIRETLTVTAPAPREQRTTDIGKRAAEWSAEDLQAYVVRQIEDRTGAFPKDPVRLNATFKGFLTRYGADAGPIAVAAFETYQGRWKGSPISWQRFCKGSDPYFGDEIRERLNTA